MHKILRGEFISVLEININQIKKNILWFRSRLKKTQKFCAVVKADAYGLGAKKICREIEGLVDYFAVSSTEEFLEINKHINKPILLLDPIYENITFLAKQNCEFCVSNFEQLNIILRQAKRNKLVEYKIHISFNTGMNRFGFDCFEDVFEVVDKIKKTQNVSIFGVFSHFYQGNNEIFAKYQSVMLKKLKDKLRQRIDVSKIIFHISNTSGFEFQKCFDMVRIGIGMYCFNNQNVFTLKTKICELKSLKENDTAGYGLGFIARNDCDVAICAIGYADGVPRKAAGSAFVLIKNRLCKILAVCMDSIIVDVSNLIAKRGDIVTIFGKTQEGGVSCCEFAAWCDTIDYEIMTGINKRVKRKYIGVKTNADNNWKI